MATKQKDVKGLVTSSAPIVADYRSIGSTGLNQFGGRVLEDSIRLLNGREAAKTYKEMGETDAVCASALSLYQNIIRGVQWPVREATDKPDDLEAAEFVETCFKDLDQPFPDVVSEHLSMLQYGYAAHEIIYKRRCGRAEEPWLRSKYQDGRIGWRALPIRSADTIENWEFDEAGTMTAVFQYAPPTYQRVRIPAEKLALFRLQSYKNNPEGLSLLRGMYPSWYWKRGVRAILMIGIERDTCGMPVVKVPASYMTEGASEAEKGTVQDMIELATNLRNDTQMGTVFPSEFDENNNQMFDLSLMASPGQGRYDLPKIIQQLDEEMYRRMGQDFMMLGSGGSAPGLGGGGMHEGKYAMFIQFCETICNQITSTYNRHLIPRLMELNGFQISDTPQLSHTPIEQVDPVVLSNAFANFARAGVQFTPSEDGAIEKRIYEIMGFPTPVDPNRTKRSETQMPAYVTGENDQLEETPSQEMVASGISDQPVTRRPGEQAAQVSMVGTK